MRTPVRVATDGAGGVDLDAELARARGGSRSALGRLLARVEPRLRRRAGRDAGRRLAGKVERSDLVQLVLYTAARDFASFRNERFGGFVRWVDALYRAQVVKVRRDWGRQKRAIGREAPPGRSTARPREVADPAAPPPSEHARQVERRRAIDEALERLGPAERLVVVLFYRDGLTHAEIAERLKLHEGTVERRFKRAKNSLAYVLRPFDDQPRAEPGDRG